MPLGDRTTIAGGFGCFSLRGVLPLAAASSEAGTSIVIALTGRKTPGGFDTLLDDARALRGDPKSCVTPGPAGFGVGIVGMESSSRPIMAHSKLGFSNFRGARFLILKSSPVTSTASLESTFVRLPVGCLLFIRDVEACEDTDCIWTCVHVLKSAV
jgi:hypothetical protein